MTIEFDRFLSSYDYKSATQQKAHRMMGFERLDWFSSRPGLEQVADVHTFQAEADLVLLGREFLD